MGLRRIVGAPESRRDVAEDTVGEDTIGPGTVLAGRFTLEDLLDESSGALFWRATDQVLARSVAVHVLPDTDPRASALLGGARSSALVSDPRLLRVLDAAAADGMVYVVNEWGSGVSLDRLLAEGALSPRRAAWLVQEVADAIAVAHRNGVAHGRLLPENVMVSEAGTVKLIGFVVDAILRSPGGQRLVTDGSPLTARASDVVNLAGLLYAALVCRWPGTEGSTIPVAPAEHGRPLRPRRVRAGVPRPLDAICEQVLNGQLHPNVAPIDTALEIKAALSDFLGDPSGSSAWAPPGNEPTAVLDRAALERTGPDRSGPDRSWPDRSGPDRSGPDRSGPDRSGPDEDAPDQLPAADDPEATQAAAPVFREDDASDPRSGSPGDVGQDTVATPGPDRARRFGVAPSAAPPERSWQEELTERPLFADGRAANATGASRGSYGPATYRDSGYTGNGHGDHPGSASTGSTPTESGPPTGSSTHDAFTGASTGSQRSVGAGNGSVPPVWGPDADQPADADQSGLDPDSGDEDLPGRSWLRLAVVLAVVLVLVLGTVFALNLGRGPADDPATTTSPSASASDKPTASRPVPISGVRDFDPQGDPPEENPDLADLAVDGKPGTYWKTVTYRGNPRLGGLKSGVGLLVDLGKKTRVGDVRLTLGGSPTSLQILAAPGATAAPTSTEGLTTVATDAGAGSQVDLRLEKTVSTRWLVVWLTSLPPAPGGFQGRVAEISARS